MFPSLLSAWFALSPPGDATEIDRPEGSIAPVEIDANEPPPGPADPLAIPAAPNEGGESAPSEADPEPLVAATYIHCIDSGLVGRHFDEPEELKAWKEKLSRCLPKSASPAAPTKTLVASAKPTLRYVLLALSVVAGFHVVFALFALFK